MSKALARRMFAYRVFHMVEAFAASTEPPLFADQDLALAAGSAPKKFDLTFPSWDYEELHSARACEEV